MFNTRRHNCKFPRGTELPMRIETNVVLNDFNLEKPYGENDHFKFIGETDVIEKVANTGTGLKVISIKTGVYKRYECKRKPGRGVDVFITNQQQEQETTSDLPTMTPVKKEKKEG
jgi:hypothetical protein